MSQNGEITRAIALNILNKLEKLSYDDMDDFDKFEYFNSNIKDDVQKLCLLIL